VSEHERSRSPFDRVDVRPCDADRSLQLEDPSSLAPSRARTGATSSAGERRLRSAIAIAAIQTKKPTNPRNVIPSITLETGESIPSQPAKTPVKSPSQPIQRGTERVRREAHAYSGTTMREAIIRPRRRSSQHLAE
jgi:hypothetical protein